MREIYFLQLNRFEIKNQTVFIALKSSARGAHHNYQISHTQLQLTTELKLRGGQIHIPIHARKH